MPELEIAVERMVIVGGTPASRAEFRAAYEASALEWLERASAAEVAGRAEDAAAALAVASVAARVACGGRR